MDNFNWVALLVAVVGGGGVGVAIREVISVITLARQGVSGREDKRRSDIVAQRDWEMARADQAEKERDEAEAYYELERSRRRIVEDELTLARRQIISLGAEPRPFPTFT